MTRLTQSRNLSSSFLTGQMIMTRRDPLAAADPTALFQLLDPSRQVLPLARKLAK
jgi:hypothetical protein